MADSPCCFCAEIAYHRECMERELKKKNERKGRLPKFSFSGTAPDGLTFFYLVQLLKFSIDRYHSLETNYALRTRSLGHFICPLLYVSSHLSLFYRLKHS